MEKETLGLDQSNTARNANVEDHEPSLKDIEAETEQNTTDDVISASTLAPIQSRGRPLSKTQTKRSQRSYGGEDGYSCHRGGPEDVEAGHEDKRFEVKFDGDNDPMSPRSLSLFRKWIVVFIMAGSALCVYVVAPPGLKGILEPDLFI